MSAQQLEPCRPTMADVTVPVGTVLRAVWASMGRQ